jgi:hypothetical protein
MKFEFDRLLNRQARRLGWAKIENSSRTLAKVCGRPPAGVLASPSESYQHDTATFAQKSQLPRAA